MWKAVLWAIALLIALLCAELTLAGAGGRIEGRVVDPEGATVGGVTVALARTGEARVTGADGKFAFGGLPVGECLLELSLGGISLGERAARVEARRTTRVEIRVENSTPGFATTATSRSRGWARRSNSLPCPVPQGVRLDKHFENGGRLTLEGGTADFAGGGHRVVAVRLSAGAQPYPPPTVPAGYGALAGSRAAMRRGAILCKRSHAGDDPETSEERR